MSKLDLEKTGGKLRELLSNGSLVLPAENIMTKLFPGKKETNTDESYPDIFEQFFVKLAKEATSTEDADDLQLMLLVMCKAELN